MSEKQEDHLQSLNKLSSGFAEDTTKNEDWRNSMSSHSNSDFSEQFNTYQFSIQNPKNLKSNDPPIISEENCSSCLVI